MTRIGWIGTGALGSAIVGRLLDDGAEVVVYNRTTAKARALCSKGAQLASSAREVMETSEVTFVCLSGEEAAERVLLDPVNGVVAADPSARPCILDVSTLNPDFAISLHHRLHCNGIDYLDCPVSGGCEGARQGQLTAVMSGDNVLIERHRNVVLRFAKSVHNAGGPGNAQLLKVLNNLAESINLWGAAEVVAVAQRYGISATTLRSVVSKMRGYSVYMDVLLRRLIGDEQSASFTLGGRVKDLRLAKAVCDKSLIVTPLSDFVLQLYERASGELGIAVDQTECLTAIQNRVGKWNEIPRCASSAISSRPALGVPDS